MKTPVLIVGAGPAGLVLALSLLINGVSVRIIDKEKKHRLGERGAGVMPRSLELHNLLGTLDDILDIAGPVLPIQPYEHPGGTKPLKTAEMSPHVKPTPQCPYTNIVVIGQNHHERILRSHLERYGCSVELGTELRSLEERDDHVVAHVEREIDGKPVSEIIEAEWLVGTDGARSVVRKQLGLTFLGETRDGDRGVIGDIIVKEGVDRNVWNLWGNDPTKQMIMLRPSAQDPDVCSFFALGSEVDHEKIASDREEFVNFFDKLTGRKDVVFGKMLWTSTYKANVRMVEKFHQGRVFIAGDAAHCHSPTGGQGLNSSIQDLFNLGWKLALVQRGLSSLALLDSYDQERLPVIAEMLSKTTELLNTARKSRGNDDTRFKRGGEFNQLGVNYRCSPVIFDEEQPVADAAIHTAYDTASATAAQAGDRAPEAPGLLEINTSQMTSLFKIFGASYHSVLIFSGGSEEHRALIKVLKKYPGDTVKCSLIVPRGSEWPSYAAMFHRVLIDGQDFAYSGYFASKEKVSVVVVRPDGVIGARVSSAAGIQHYFEGIFIQ